ncbi:MAG TPA: DUF1801 domain-containing protein [Balneolaceae bacterium]
MAKTDFKSIDEYISAFPEDVQEVLEQIRRIIQKAVPEAEEVISYQMPTFRLNGILVHFAAHKHHIGFYPTPSGITAFPEELPPYEPAKGSVKFPLNEPMPLDLKSDMVKFRAEENMTRMKVNKQK